MVCRRRAVAQVLLYANAGAGGRAGGAGVGRVKVTAGGRGGFVKRLSRVFFFCMGRSAVELPSKAHRTVAPSVGCVPEVWILRLLRDGGTG